MLLLFRNQVKLVEMFVFIGTHLIYKTRYSKMVKSKDMQIFMENLKFNRNWTKIFFDLSERGFEPQILSSFPAHDLNFQVRVTRSNQNKLLKEI